MRPLLVLTVIAACAPPTPLRPQDPAHVTTGMSNERELATGLLLTSGFFATVSAYNVTDVQKAQLVGDAAFESRAELKAGLAGVAALGTLGGAVWLYAREPATRPVEPHRPSNYMWKLGLADLAAVTLGGLAVLTFRPHGEGDFAAHPDNTLPIVLGIGAIGVWGVGPAILHVREDESWNALSSMALRGTAAYIALRGEPSIALKVSAVVCAMALDDLLLSQRFDKPVVLAPVPGGAVGTIGGRF